MARPLSRIRALDLDLSLDLRLVIESRFGSNITLGQLERKLNEDRDLLGKPMRREARLVIREASRVLNAERDRRRARSRAANKCWCGNEAKLGTQTCGRHTPDEEWAADIAGDAEALAEALRLLRAYVNRVGPEVGQMLHNEAVAFLETHHG